VIVHNCDDMTARLAAVDEIADRTAQGERWSAWCNMMAGYTYLAEAVDAAAPDVGVPTPPAASADEAPPDDGEVPPDDGETVDRAALDDSGASLF